jgi:hypothetical protein
MQMRQTKQPHPGCLEELRLRPEKDSQVDSPGLYCLSNDFLGVPKASEPFFLNLNTFIAVCSL